MCRIIRLSDMCQSRERYQYSPSTMYSCVCQAFRFAASVAIEIFARPGKNSREHVLHVSRVGAGDWYRHVWPYNLQPISDPTMVNKVPSELC